MICYRCTKNKTRKGSFICSSCLDDDLQRYKSGTSSGKIVCQAERIRAWLKDKTIIGEMDIMAKTELSYKEKVEEVGRLKEKGWSNADIGVELGVKPSTVSVYYSDYKKRKAVVEEPTLKNAAVEANEPTIEHVIHPEDMSYGDFVGMAIAAEDLRERKVQLQESEDNVNNPSHYTKGKYETIDIIKDMLSPEQFKGYCLGNVLKYIARHEHKNGVEDLEKAQVYLGWGVEAEKDIDLPTRAEVSS